MHVVAVRDDLGIAKSPSSPGSNLEAYHPGR